MRTKHDVKWLAHYNELRIYLEEHHQLPDKKRTENRALLNWWKYNKKLFKAGRLTEERLKLLHQLNDCATRRFSKYKFQGFPPSLFRLFAFIFEK